MKKYATLYDLCDVAVLRREPAGEPGKNLRLVYKALAGNPFLKHLMLARCGHPALPKDGPSPLAAAIRQAMGRAMHATPENWRNPAWVREAFAPVAELMDASPEREWKRREPLAGEAGPEKSRRRFTFWSRGAACPLTPENLAPALSAIREAVTAHVFAVWDGERKDPHFPVAAQVVLAGDEQMTGERFLEVLAGLGSVEYQNATLMLGLVRCFLLANPRKLSLLRRPWKGLAEPLNLPLAWIMHRTAFYDVIFFEQLLARAAKARPGLAEYGRLLEIMESLLRYILVTSREWLTAPLSGRGHPAITCLPKDEAGNPLCSMSARDWKMKQDLGFGDYVPDVDTTFLGLAMARKWLDLARERKIPADPALLAECEAMLDHPWVSLIGEYQAGGGNASHPPTITMGNPLDLHGSVPLWWDKPFPRPDGSVAREVLGNEVCAGHNMDILDTILLNRDRWKSLEGENLAVTRRFLEFHHRAFLSGNFKDELSVRFYRPETYVYYAGRMYETWLALSPEEKVLLDPEGKVEDIRRKALDHLDNELTAQTMNPFDAALAATALVLLRCEARHGAALSRAVTVLADHLGEGGRKGPYKAYEWTLVRYPSRIIVGSPVATSLFVLNACVEAERWLATNQTSTFD